ncbi:MAG: TrpB-like pyridoxal phosphate-dependent enzyme [Desulfitobacteriaceae bacterium]|nr:TrpB-like pyridoxal phosphate-dependent enzyme [Desulfitobacteriaceae bacterium]MDD4346390.1 TrpB-like pyridoxal phosphate-dependent enzyme [Desulfitobacteriaceae bacterium]MDD4401662.1 TrpB-like pyridoxal phosphate-dependent enzyme [Desulfitobacteriaceae bacterium]
MSDINETKIYLSEKEIPTHWYNIMADMPNLPQPALNPQTRQPAEPPDLISIFPMDLIMQEVSQERFIEIPEEVRNLYKLWRPSPVFRAHRLEKALDTPAKIFYKYEGLSPAGSHKLNTAIPQVYYNKKAGIKRLTTETGAGQWGSALGMACNFFGLECVVYMVKISYQQKPYRRSLMQLFGSQVFASPSENTNVGRQFLAQDPNSPGSLGMAISEAVEDAVGRPDTNYALGSVLNHVIIHQSVIGLEAQAQMAKVDAYPDIVIACCGGGSNFAGIGFPYVYNNLTKNDKVRVIAVEPEACPTLTRGTFTYDFGDVSGMTPLLSMYTLGKDFMPAGIHAGGLRYHGGSPLVSQLLHDGLIEAKAVNQKGIFEAALTFARSEGIVPAPEASHAIKGAIDEALACKESGESKTILFCLSGHGHFDMTAYDNYLSGQIQDFSLPQETLDEAIKKLPKV